MYKIGQEVRVIGNSAHHEFRIGETVRIKSLPENGHVNAAESLDGRKRWFIDENDIQPIDACRLCDSTEQLMTVQGEFICRECGKKVIAEFSKEE